MELQNVPLKKFTISQLCALQYLQKKEPFLFQEGRDRAQPQPAQNKAKFQPGRPFNFQHPGFVHSTSEISHGAWVTCGPPSAAYAACHLGPSCLHCMVTGVSADCPRAPASPLLGFPIATGLAVGSLAPPSLSAKS